MIEVEFQRRSLEDWEAGISRIFRKQLEIANGAIIRDWLMELQRQIMTWDDRTWPPLSPKYADRKWRDFKNYHADIKGIGKVPSKGHATERNMLMRTGQMMEGYAAGITTFVTRGYVGVEMPYPTGTDKYTGKPLRIRAEAHQGTAASTPGGVIRPFNLEKLGAVALAHYNEAMSRAADIASNRRV